MAETATTATKLLEELREATADEDFKTAAQTLKRMLQPWGLRLMQDAAGPDIFTEEDFDLLGNFWRAFLKLDPGEKNILRRASNPFILLDSASREREFTEVGELAKQLCPIITRVAAEQVEKYRACLEEDSSPKKPILYVVR